MRYRMVWNTELVVHVWTSIVRARRLSRTCLTAASVAVACAACAHPVATAGPTGVTQNPGVAAASGTSAPTTLSDGFVALDDKSARNEYAAAIAKVGQPLPTGLAYPSGLPAGFIPPDGVLQEGAARNQVFFTWLCAWEGEYLSAEAAQNTDRQAEATAELTWWSTGWFYTQVEQDPSHGWIADVLTPLQVGDSSGVRAEYNNMCTKYPTVPSTNG